MWNSRRIVRVADGGRMMRMRRAARSRRARELGQNFLVDRNILDVIERLAELRPDDVVLEVGGGPGILSARLAERVRHVHVVEVDRALEEQLRDAVSSHDNVSVHMGDALELDPASLDPVPNKVVANLPYAVAATVVLRTIDQLLGVSFWLVMVQREVGERLAASPGSAAYGAPSVLAQLACDVKVVRAIPRTVFRPVPRVDSVLVRLLRRDPAAGPPLPGPAGGASPPGPAVGPPLRKLINDSFAHRRKTLAGSLALSTGWPEDVRHRAAAALRELGHPADERAERLSPQELAELARRLSS
jgi:16S rRNA (adenine1518-N6/adenine1519-N6)-dimethyltransferase